MKRTKNMAGWTIVGVTTLLVTVLIAPAEARPVRRAVRLAPTCGQILEDPGDYTLTGNMDCFDVQQAIWISGHDIHLDLGGFTVSGVAGSAFSQPGTNEVGILITGNNNSVEDGVVRKFEAGIEVTLDANSGGGEGNVIGPSLLLHENVGQWTGSAEDPHSHGGAFGDGLVLAGATGTIVHDNEIRHNGQYSGIAILAGILGGDVLKYTTASEIYGNIIEENINPVVLQNPPFSITAQAVGIRIEGGQDNYIHDNQINRNWLDGIGIFDVPVSEEPNQGNRIIHNTLTANGQGFTSAENPTIRPGRGISVFAGLGGVVPAINNTISNNTVTDTLGFGIYAEDGTSGNKFVGNEAHNNGVINGQNISEFKDLFDENLNCRENSWRNNHAEKVNPPCTLAQRRR